MTTRNHGTRSGASGGTPGALVAADATETGEASKLLRLTAASRAVVTDVLAAGAVFGAAAVTFAADVAASIGLARATSGAGRGLTIQPGRAAAGSAAAGGTLALKAGEPDVVGTQAHGPIEVTAGSPIVGASSPIDFLIPAGTRWSRLYYYYGTCVHEGPNVGYAITITATSFYLDAGATRWTVSSAGVGAFGLIAAQQADPGSVVALTDSTGGTAAGTMAAATDFATTNNALASLAAKIEELRVVQANIVSGVQAFGFFETP